mmetsp:Transcript_28156/g.41138  ORF Transcript_28156/g.41138 Transcript_28156/m.41138 type:complete len:228 (+) Transcript_28156:136-819(+)
MFFLFSFLSIVCVLICSLLFPSHVRFVLMYYTIRNQMITQPKHTCCCLDICLHFSTGCLRTILHPRSSTDRTDAGCLSNVWEIINTNCINTKCSNISTADRSSLTFNNIDNSSWCVNSETTRPYNAVIKTGGHYCCLLIILVIKNLLHRSGHQNLEKEWCLVLGITCTNGCYNCKSLHSFFLHGVNDKLCSISKHGVTYISCLSSKGDDNSINAILKHLCNIGRICD